MALLLNQRFDRISAAFVDLAFYKLDWGGYLESVMLPGLKELNKSSFTNSLFAFEMDRAKLLQRLQIRNPLSSTI